MNRYLPLLIILFLLMQASFAQKTVVKIPALDFEGGGLNPVLSYHFERYDVNAIYPVPKEKKSTMSASFNIDKLLESPQLKLEAHGYPEDNTICEISITVNGKEIFSGDPKYSGKEWEEKTFDIPKGLLVGGKNTLSITNTMSPGEKGEIPWLIISSASLGEKGFDSKDKSNLFNNFSVVLPEKKVHFSEKKENKGFKLRGIKGWDWTPEQTLQEIPVLKKFKMNFFMNCYTSMYDHPNDNKWYEPLTNDFKAAYEKIVAECKKYDVEFCFAMNPNFLAQTTFDYDNKRHFDIIWKNYKWMADLGVNWFSVCLDDIAKGLDASGQARFINKLYAKLKQVNPKAEMIFCPSIYASNYIVDGVNNNEYLRILAKELHPDIYCFWTGDFFCGPVSYEKGKQMKELLEHRLIIWDNYPVNDGGQAMSLGPVVMRDPSLTELCDGYMANPMRTQNQIGRVPIYTCADFAWNPYEYDPLESIGQAILDQSQSLTQASTLKDLVEVYFGFLFDQTQDYWYVRNSAKHTLEKLLAQKHGEVPSILFVRHMENILRDMKINFPDMYRAERETIEIDIDWMRRMIKEKYPYEKL